MSDSDRKWRDWQNIKEKREQRQRARIHGRIQEKDKLWVKIILYSIAAPYLIIIGVYIAGYTISYYPLWIALGIFFDPIKWFAHYLAIIAGLLTVVLGLYGVVLGLTMF